MVSVSNARPSDHRPKAAVLMERWTSNCNVSLTEVLKEQVNLVIVGTLVSNNRCVASFELPSPDAKVVSQTAPTCMPEAMRPVFLVALVWAQFFPSRSDR